MQGEWRNGPPTRDRKPKYGSKEEYRRRYLEKCKEKRIKMVLRDIAHDAFNTKKELDEKER